MSHITIIIGSGSGGSLAASSESSVDVTASYVPANDMTWEEIGIEVEKIKKKLDKLD